jgi:hypothetical protein
LLLNARRLEKVHKHLLGQNATPMICFRNLTRCQDAH